MHIILSERLNNVSEKIAFILLNVLAADVCIFGAGRIIEFGPLTFRMALLLLIFIICIPLFLKNFKSLLKSNYIRAILIFFILLIFSTAIGIIHENRTNLILTDIKGFVYFAFLPCSIVLINSFEKVTVLAKTCMYSAAVQALIHVIFICLYIADVPWLDTFSNFSDERRFFYVSYRISASNVRVNFLSLICLLLGVVFSIYFSIKATSKASKIIYPLISSICCFSLFMSYTRSVYLAVVITLFLLLFFALLVMTKKERILLLKNLLVIVVVFFVIIAGFNIRTGENYFTYGLSRALVGIDIFDDLIDIQSHNTDIPFDSETSNVDATTDLENNNGEYLDSFHKSTVISDDIRTVTVSELVSNIKKSPVIGLGLGSEIPSRPDGLNEYFFLDLLSKMGIVGLCCYLSPFVFMLIELVRSFKKNRKVFYSMLPWFCVLVGFVSYSYFTPCMNSSVGVLFYCCVMGVFQLYKKSE